MYLNNYVKEVNLETNLQPKELQGNLNLGSKIY